MRSAFEEIIAEVQCQIFYFQNLTGIKLNIVQDIFRSRRIIIIFIQKKIYI